MRTKDFAQSSLIGASSVRGGSFARAKLSLLVLICVSAFAPVAFAADSPPPITSANNATFTEGSYNDPVALRAAYAQIPMAFEANTGQTDPQVQYFARGSGYTIFMTAKEAVVSLQGRQGDHGVVRLKLSGANEAAPIEPLNKLAGTSNYFIGNDPAKWRTNIPLFSEVRYTSVYPGIDLLYHGNQRQLEYDFIVAPGADPRAIKLICDGADKIDISKEGDLVLQVGAKEVRFQKPFVYQELNGKRREVAARYVLDGKRGAGFEVAAYDKSKSLVIDPVLVYSTYLGGTSVGLTDVGQDIAVDSAGNAYVTGNTESADFPTTSGTFDTTYNGVRDVFVTKLDPAGSALVYSTYLGGTAFDSGSGIALDSTGNAYVTGNTMSADFPTTSGAFDTTFNGVQDVFVTKLDPAGSALVYSTYLGSPGTDIANDIFVSGPGTAYVTGSTDAIGFPVVAPTIASYQGGTDAFLTKLTAAGDALAYSTYWGSDGFEEGTGVTVDPTEAPYITGNTTAPNFPTMTPYQAALSGGTGQDAFMTKFAVSPGSIVYSTYLGGAGNDQANDITVTANSEVLITGSTTSTNFPTTPGAFDPTHNGGRDAFVTKFTVAGNVLAYSTYLGGLGTDVGSGFVIDSAGNAYVTGNTSSADFPTTPGAFDTTFNNGVQDAFVTKLNPPGSALVYSTYLGGTGADFGLGIAIDSAGSAYVTGYTGSADFPTTPGAFDTTLNGGQDAFVLKIFTSPSCVSAPPNMVSWWPGDGNADDIQDSNHGSLVGGTTFAAGEVDQGFSLDGLNDFVQIPDSASLSVTSAITIDAWINPDTITGSAAGRTIVSKYDTGGEPDQYSYLLFIVNGGQVEFAVYNNAASGAVRYVVTPGTITPGVFTHVAATFDTATQEIKIYLNGVDTAAPLGGGSTTVDSIFDSDTPVRIGAHKEGAAVTGFFDGVIDEVEIFNRALSATEIASIYGAGSFGKCKCTEPPAEMISWWPAEGNTDDIRDSNNLSDDGNGVGYGAGKVGQAFTFNGNQFLTAGDPANLALTGTEVTIDGWIKPTDNTEGVLFGKSVSGGNDYCLFIFNDRRLTGFIKTDNGGEIIVGGIYQPPVDEWTHVALTYDGATVKIYANGVLVNSAAKTGNLVSSSSPFNIGGRLGGDLTWKGSIDEVEVFDVALDAPAITKIYRAGSAGKCRSNVCTTYSEFFTQDEAPSSQAAQHWLDFRAGLNPSAYDTVTISGTFDPNGRTLTNATIVPQIAQALKDGTSFSVMVGAFTWNVGAFCASTADVELNANLGNDNTWCNCQGNGYVVRPSIGVPNWGGVNTATCDPPSQTITVTFCGPPPAVPAERQFLNISSRADVGIGENVAIGGFIIHSDPGGTAQTRAVVTKLVLIRGLGPSLNITGQLEDPFLELRDSNGALIISNDNWGDAANAGDIPSGLVPSDPDEAAILRDLNVDSIYTAILSGAGNTTGIGLVEVYDLDALGDSHLANISTRAFVSTDDDVLIGGFIVRGGTPSRVVLRGIGPSLTGQGVSNALLDPILELHDGNGALIETNDDWQNAPNAIDIALSGLAPTDTKESAILFVPAPGAYTAIVRGVGGTTGIGLVEAYNIGP